MEQNQKTNIPTSKPLSVYYHALRPSDVAIYRLVRLRALSEAPSQFSSTFTRELAFTMDKWKGRIENPDGITFLATSQPTLELADALNSEDWIEPYQFEASDSVYYGLIICLQSYEVQTDAFIAGFWVAPSARFQGIGQTLIEKALTWAKSHGEPNKKFMTVLLDVHTSNLTARRVYERSGFISTGTSPDDSEELRYVQHL